MKDEDDTELRVQILTAWHSACSTAGKTPTEQTETAAASPEAWGETIEQAKIPHSARSTIATALAHFTLETPIDEIDALLKNVSREILDEEAQWIEKIALHPGVQGPQYHFAQLMAKGSWIRRAGVMEEIAIRGPETDEAVAFAVERGWGKNIWAEDVERSAAQTYLRACERLRKEDQLGAAKHLKAIGPGEQMVWIGNIPREAIATLVGLAHRAVGDDETPAETKRRVDEGFGPDANHGTLLWDAWVDAWELGNKAPVGATRIAAAARWWGAHDPAAQVSAFEAWVAQNPRWIGRSARQIETIMQQIENDRPNEDLVYAISAALIHRILFLAGGTPDDDNTTGLLGQCEVMEYAGASQCAIALVTATRRIEAAGNEKIAEWAWLLTFASLISTGEWGGQIEYRPRGTEADDTDDEPVPTAHSLGLPEWEEEWMEDPRAPTSVEEAQERISVGLITGTCRASERAIDQACDRWPDNLELAKMLVSVALHRGMTLKAAEDIDRALELAEDDIGQIANEYAALEYSAHAHGDQEPTLARLGAHGIDISTIVWPHNTVEHYVALLETTGWGAKDANEWGDRAIDAEIEGEEKVWLACLHKALEHPQGNAESAATLAWELEECERYEQARTALNRACELADTGKGTKGDIARTRIEVIDATLEGLNKEIDQVIGPDDALSALAKDLRYDWKKMDGSLKEWRTDGGRKSRLSRRLRLPRRPLRIARSARKSLGVQCCEEIERTSQMRRAHDEAEGSKNNQRCTWLLIVQLHHERELLVTKFARNKVALQVKTL